MASHRSVNLKLRDDKPDNVYRYIHEWESVPSSHGDDIRYLLLYELVQWGEERDYPINVFSIAMQYAKNIGENVDVSQPVHIAKDDIDVVNSSFEAFVEKCKRTSRNNF